jgi:hypothetical protein
MLHAKTLVGLAAALALTAGGALAQTHSKTAPVKPKPDLADAAEGTYAGSVISDARGAGRSDVTITVTKSGPNTVDVSSSYERLPPFTIKLTRAMSTIQQVGTKVVFLLELNKSPHMLGVTDDDASFSGAKQ